jgi:hypothetical protein
MVFIYVNRKFTVQFINLKHNLAITEDQNTTFESLDVAKPFFDKTWKLVRWKSYFRSKDSGTGPPVAAIKLLENLLTFELHASLAFFI